MGTTQVPVTSQERTSAKRRNPDAEPGFLKAVAGPDWVPIGRPGGRDFLAKEGTFSPSPDAQGG
jgi:hypothetical protein